ncbi:hypothetical protein RJ639_043855 [Escallonia herrerae]|uniref:Pectinesterase inhibitor domain-containing protein n=1 Tax=Escallonia herrerae TaxID=1293975 RepID=A0AA88WCQ8_9ASTE|nr:hypothetical protein RJ639_043855 [Escallonia herrerae]
MRSAPQSLNPSLCFQALRSDPRAATADLVGLGNISINLAQDSVQLTSKLIDSLAKKTSDPALKGQYSSCLANFGDATDSLNESEESLRSGATQSKEPKEKVASIAFSSSISALLLSLLAAILVPNLTLANASVKSSSQLISEVSSKVPNSALCLEALKSDPRSANADLVGLGRISIDLMKAAT